MNIIEMGKWTEVEQYEHSFVWKDCLGAGFGFPCDINGKVLDMPEQAKENYRFCITDKGNELIDEGIKDISYSYYEVAIGLCECGNKLSLDGDSMGEVGCSCGKVYNIFGQELNGFSKEFVGMNEFGEYWEDY